MKRSPRQILFLCWTAYALCYLLRVNIAVIIPAIVSDRICTLTQMGLITSVYFAVYMSGQLINGYLGDRFSSKALMVCGLTLSAACNLGMAMSGAFPSLLIFWAINGLAQSMLWGPIMKTLTVWFQGYQLEKVSFVMSMSMIVGNGVSWGFSSIIVSRLGWAYAFILPALLVLAFAIVLLIFFQGRPTAEWPADKPVLAAGTAAGAETAPSAAVPVRLPILSYIRMIRLPGLLLIGLFQGLIREGISVWLPTILDQSGRIDRRSPWLILIAIPVVNFGGILLIRRLNQRLRCRSTQTLLLTFTAIAGMSLLLNLQAGQAFGVTLPAMAVLLALTYGMTPILTSVIPFQFAHFKHVALTAGAIDFAIYSGAAISGALSGLLADRFGWSGVMRLWLAAAAVGLGFSIYRYYSEKGRQTHEQTIHHPS